MNYLIFFLFIVVTNAEPSYFLFSCPPHPGYLFNICINDEGKYYSTTSSNLGYGAKIRIDSDIELDFYKASFSKYDINISTTFLNNENNQISIVHTIQNIGSTEKNVGLSINSEPRLDDDNTNISLITNKGFMISNDIYDFRISFDYVPITTLWCGSFDDKFENYWEDSDDSCYADDLLCLTYSWQNLTIMPNQIIVLISNFKLYKKIEPSTSEFTESTKFSQSHQFTSSHVFSSSLHFSKSNTFSSSLKFSKSNFFTKRNSFSENPKQDEFSYTNHFSDSFQFNESYSFNETDFILNDQKQDSGKKKKSIIIALGVICGILGVALIAILVVFIVCRKLKYDKESSEGEGSSKIDIDETNRQKKSKPSIDINGKEVDYEFWS